MSIGRAPGEILASSTIWERQGEAVWRALPPITLAMRRETNSSLVLSCNIERYMSNCRHE